MALDRNLRGLASHETRKVKVHVPRVFCLILLDQRHVVVEEVRVVHGEDKGVQAVVRVVEKVIEFETAEEGVYKTVLVG